MHSTSNHYLDKLITPLLLIAGATLAMAAFTTSAAAASLDELYQTMMTIRGCEIVVTEEEWENLTVAIEQTVSGSGASSDTVNGIFDDIKAAMSVDIEAYCTDQADDVAAVLASLS